MRSVRLRPGWHRVLGFGSIVLGVAIVVLNDLMWGTTATLLPGGHSELYLLLGLVVAVSSLWWFGWLDRER